MRKHVGPQAEAHVWRRFGRFLWAGTGPTGPVGTVQQGHRYVAIDTLGAVRGRCRSLAEAQQLLEHISDATPVAAMRTDGHRGSRADAG